MVEFSQASEQDQQTAVDAEAQKASSPDETDGSTSSVEADEGQESFAEHVEAKFLEKYGAKDDNDDKSAVKDGEDKPSEAASQEGDKAPKSDAATDKPETERKDDANSKQDDDFRLSDEEFAELSDKTRGRIGVLTKNVRKAERERDELNARLQESQTDIQGMQNLREFVRENDMDQSDVEFSFEYARMKSTGAWTKEMVTAVETDLAQAKAALGIGDIPADLQEQVDHGAMTPEAAQSLAKARADALNAEKRAERAERRQEQSTQERAAQDARTAIISAAATREAELKADPNYAQRADALKESLGILLSHSRPQNAEEMVQMVNTAWDMAGRMTPAPAPKADPKAQETAPQPSSSNTSRGSTPAKPKTLLAAMEAAPAA